MEFTALTLPLILSGVFNCTSECRTTTLITSAAPSITREQSENSKDFDIPKNIVPIPNIATAKNIVRPTRLRKGLYERKSDINNAPTAGAERSTPSPKGPIFSMSWA